MTARPKLKSDAFEVIHFSAQELLKIGAIDKATCVILMRPAW